MKYSSNKDFQVYIASLVASKKWTYKKTNGADMPRCYISTGRNCPCRVHPVITVPYEISRRAYGILPGKNKP